VGRMRLIVGTRGSKLAIAQTDEVIKALSKKLNVKDVRIEKKIIKTSGDKIKNSPLSQIGGRGLFTKEIDLALLRGEIDFAVHSMKDLPTILLEGIEIACVPKRASPYDIFFSREKKKLEEMPKNAVIGTSSTRRRAQLLRFRSDFRVEPLRGNLDTRIRKVLEGKYDGAILAEAAIQRLNLKISYQRLDFLPAPAQGALAVTCRKGSKLCELLKTIEDIDSRREVFAERAALRHLGGGCQVPVAILARVKNGIITIKGAVINEGREIRASIKGNAEDYEELGKKLAEKLLEMGAEELL